MKRVLTYGFLLGGTGISCCGCYWQYSKYKLTSVKWARIQSEMDSFNPSSIALEDSSAKLPWAEKPGSILDWEYRLVEINGEFLPGCEMIQRFKDNRPGLMVIRPFLLKEKPDGSQKKGVFVNLGWIPKDMEQEIKEKQSNEKEKAKVFGILRKNEVLENLKGERQKNKLQRIVTIDLANLAQKYPFDNKDEASVAFIERVSSPDEDQEEEMYPVASTRNSFFRPYLTPEKHLEYSIFWGGSAMIGTMGMISLLIKR